MPHCFSGSSTMLTLSALAVGRRAVVACCAAAVDAPPRLLGATFTPLITLLDPVQLLVRVVVVVVVVVGLVLIRAVARGGEVRRHWRVHVVVGPRLVLMLAVADGRVRHCRLVLDVGVRRVVVVAVVRVGRVVVAMVRARVRKMPFLTLLVRFLSAHGVRYHLFSLPPPLVRVIVGRREVVMAVGLKRDARAVVVPGLGWQRCGGLVWLDLGRRWGEGAVGLVMGVEGEMGCFVLVLIT